MDYVIANVEKIPANVRWKYERDGAMMVNPKKGEARALEKRKIKLLEKKIIEVDGYHVKHNTRLLSEILISLV